MASQRFSVLGKWTLIIGVIASILTLGSLLGQFHWTLDVLSHFHLQYSALLIIVVPVLLLLSSWRSRTLLLVPALLVNLYMIVPFFVVDILYDDESGSADATPLRVLSMNISTSTDGYPQVVELIRERNPDIVFMSEVRSDLVVLLQNELSEQYPIQHAEPSRFTLGIAILARSPDVSVQKLSADADMGRMSRNYLRADFMWEGTPVSLVGIHPLPPMQGNWADGRNREIALMGTLSKEADQPFILVGDLNASPWSVPMRRLIMETELRYATDGHGIWPTWLLAQQYVGPLLGVPLDHILVSPEWIVADYTESGDIGSDHVPLQADLFLWN
ncbi:MAG: endonuclease/exonuclease/phosphatase family protein [Chloroflexota bacterium]